MKWLLQLSVEKQTILSSNFQFDLVCDRGSLPFVSTSVIFAGHFIGSIAVSTISDKFGRKIPLYVCGFFCCLFNFVSAFSPAFWVFAVFRSLVGFFIGEYQVLEWINRLRGNSLLSLKEFSVSTFFRLLESQRLFAIVLVSNSPLVLYLSFLSFVFDIT